MRHLVSDDVSDAVGFELCSNVVATRRAIMQELFGVTTMKRVSISVSDVCLPRNPASEADIKKLESISKKFHTIPEQYTSYYPNPWALYNPVRAELSINSTVLRGSFRRILRLSPPKRTVPLWKTWETDLWLRLMVADIDQELLPSLYNTLYHRWILVGKKWYQSTSCGHWVF